MFRLPNPRNISVFYGAVIIELCKMQLDSMPGVVSLTTCKFPFLKGPFKQFQLLLQHPFNISFILPRRRIKLKSENAETSFGLPNNFLAECNRWLPLVDRFVTV